jgi:2-polyprenyl-3-methyl-5-hydroxy-6-metoxy-1,4-benzoquinol methylase
MPLISESYRRLLEREHAIRPWGHAASEAIEQICQFIDRHAGNEILDYGAGQAYLERELPKRYPGIKICSYDPGVPQISSAPCPCDLVVCIDVLEHVEPDCLEAVLEDLVRVTKKHGLFHVSTIPASKILLDGRNAHQIVESHDWWLDRISQNFRITNHSINHVLFESKFEVASKAL